MFRTHQSMQLGTANRTAESSFWGCIELPLQLPWLYIDARMKSNGASVALQIMDPQIFVEFLAQIPSLYSIDSIQLVTPPKMNDTKFWVMEELVSFSYIHHPEFGGSELYEVANGKIYSMLDPQETASLKGFSRKIIYKSTPKSEST